MLEDVGWSVEVACRGGRIHRCGAGSGKDPYIELPDLGQDPNHIQNLVVCFGFPPVN